MADDDYQRLGAACHCGEPVKLGGRGRPRKYCDSHVTGPGPKPPGTYRKVFGVSGVCVRCSAAFTAKIAGAKYCGAACRVAAGNEMAARNDQRNCETCSGLFYTRRRNSGARWCSDECKPKALRGLFSCLHCKQEYRKKHRHPGEGEKFCSLQCSFDAKAAARLRRKEAEAPRYSAYFAKACGRCGRADGQRRDWTLCRGCKRAEALRAASEAASVWSEAKHKAAARETTCDGCGGVFCPLYGSSNSTLCIPCADDRLREHRRIRRATRRARLKAVPAEKVDPLKVFARDGWKCRLCGIDTPKRLRGTIEHNAPELDHVRPISKGGPHTYANTQCLCRSCNQFKSDRTMDEVDGVLLS